MKTNVVMSRPMGRFNVLQRTSDGFFNATDLYDQWNKANPYEQRRLDKFWDSTHIAELMSEIAINEYNFKSPNFGELKNLLAKTKRGKHNGGTWLHPVLFIKCAMYLNPAFEYQVLRFVYDQLIKFRHEAGDRYNVLTSAIAALPNVDYREVATAINWIVFNTHGKNLRQSATQEQLKDLSYTEHTVASMVDLGVIRNHEQLMNALRVMYNKRYQKF